MSDDTEKQKYLDRMRTNQKVTGYGSEVKTHIPCPFCAAPDWMIMPITDGIDDYPVMRASHTCGECGRSARTILLRPTPDSLQFEMVQTGGPDQPDWLEPKMRRET